MSERPEMGELQAIITGALIGCLMRGLGHGLDVTVEPLTDSRGWLPEILVTGNQSHETVRVRVEEVAA